MAVVRANRVTAAAVSGVLGLMMVSACGTAGSTHGAVTSASRLEKTDLVVGVVPAETNSALFVALQQGIFAAHGLHVTIKTITSTSDVVPELQNGSLDVAAGQLTTFIAAQATGEGQYRVLAAGIEMGTGVEQLLTLGSSQITTPAELRGDVIGVNAAAGNGVLLTDNILAVYGLTPGEVKYKVVPFPDMGAALASHEVTATYAPEPYAAEMEEGIGATELIDLNQGAVQGLLIGGYAVTASWAEKYPNTAAAFTASIDEASGIADSNFSAVQRAFRTGLGVSAEVAGSMATGFFPTSVPKNGLSQVAMLMQEFHELSQDANVSALVNALTARTGSG
jgi:NitT/TauT family transport system substrate-binding protein